MRQYNGCGIDGESLLDDLSWVNGSAVDGAAEEFIEAQHTVAIIEVQAAKYLVIEVLHARLQEGLGVRGAANRLADRQ